MIAIISIYLIIISIIIMIIKKKSNLKIFEKIIYKQIDIHKI